MMQELQSILNSKCKYHHVLNQGLKSHSRGITEVLKLKKLVEEPFRTGKLLGHVLLKFLPLQTFQRAQYWDWTMVDQDVHTCVHLFERQSLFSCSTQYGQR